MRRCPGSAQPPAPLGASARLVAREVKTGVFRGLGVPEEPSLRHRSSRRFDAVLASHGLTGRVVELPESTRTAAEAARGVGCEVRQIVKSLVFRGATSGKPVLILASGANRVDEAWMAHYVGETLARADPEYVRSVAGFAIGGVPPAGHAATIPTYIDYDLLELPEIWAAAGHPHAVCRLTSRELLALTRGRPVSVIPLTPERPDPAPWVTFDCYGTLVDWRAGLLQQIERAVSPISRTERERLFHAYLGEEMRLESAAYRSYREVMTEAMLEVARSDGFELSRSQAAEAPESIPDWPAFPDAADAVDALRPQGYRVGILSNIDTDLLERTLENLGVRPDLVVTAQEVGSYKPAWNHWVRFLKRSGAAPGDVWHVSGSYEYDLEPAAALGFRTVYVARYGPLPAGKKVGISLHGLADLADHLRSDRSAPKSLSHPHE